MNGFVVMPMSQETTLAPGEIYHGTIRVANPESATENFYYRVTVNPYYVTDEDYTADLTTVSDWSQIVKWVTIEDEVGVVQPNEVQEIRYTITVPESAPAGGQYAVIAVSSYPKETNDGVTVQNVYEVGSIIYATVSGETVHSGRIVGNNIPGFALEPPVFVETMVENTGNIHDVAKTTINVKNQLTGEVLFPKEGENNEFWELVLPGTSRYITREISELPGLGIFDVSQSVEYLGEISEVSGTLIVCPIWFIILVVMLVLSVIAAVAEIVRRGRSRKAENID